MQNSNHLCLIILHKYHGVFYSLAGKLSLFWGFSSFDFSLRKLSEHISRSRSGRHSHDVARDEHSCLTFRFGSVRARSPPRCPASPHSRPPSWGHRGVSIPPNTVLHFLWSSIPFRLVSFDWGFPEGHHRLQADLWDTEARVQNAPTKRVMISWLAERLAFHL